VEDEITLAQAERHTKTLGELDGGFPKHLIIDFRGTEVSFSNEAREYFARNQQHREKRKSQAIVIDTLAQRLVANFYLKFNRPDCPVSIFQTIDQALNWVKGLDH
jgi:hypothetical protein